MPGIRSGLWVVLFGLPILPAGLTATVKEAPAVEFRVLSPSVVQNMETAGYEIAAQKAELDVPAHPDGLLETASLNPEAIAKPSDPSGDGDDFLHDGPRSKMRKWFLTILFVGGIIRYLSSDSCRRFVSETLDPLNW